jgi:threonine dehydrogenase-like Zn-dependent dehydrogenase
VIYALACDDRGHELNCGFSPCRQGQKAWRGVSKSKYHPNKAIGGRRHGGDAEYSYVPHLKNF